MNNTGVEQTLNVCATELDRVRTLIDGLGIQSPIAPYLTNYALIRACGTIEQAFKSTIADYCERRSKRQIKRFLSRKVRESSMNPSYDRICQLLNDFDEDWKVNFKSAVDASGDRRMLLDSLESLVDARNEFAHGGNPNVSIGYILDYYAHARQIIEMLDNVVC